jgi:hypothetical protein
MMRQRQITRQPYRPLAKFFVLPLLLPQKLPRPIKLVPGEPQFSAKLFLGRSELPVFLCQLLRPSPLRVATSKKIPRGFVPGRLVLSDRFREKAS